MDRIKGEAYYAAMVQDTFKSRVKAAMEASGVSKMELHRRSGVPYHAIDKFLKRDGASTSAENARAIAASLGIKIDDDNAYDELKELLAALSEEKRKSVLTMVRALANEA